MRNTAYIEEKRAKAFEYYERQQWEEAEHLCKELLSLDSSQEELLHLAGLIAYARDRYQEAINYLTQAARADRQNAKVAYNLAVTFEEVGAVQEAINWYLEAIKRKADYTQAYWNLANLYQLHGKVAEAIAVYQQLQHYSPDDARIGSNILMLLHYDTRQTEQSLYEQHLAWAGRFATSLMPANSSYPQSKEKERILRIGYVSADLKSHPVGFFLFPVLKAHDRQRYKIYIYASIIKPDEVTQRLREVTDIWRDIATLDDEAVAGLIKEDQIDILVDLSGHTAENRLLVFARKPAPIQVSWLGYFNTTGLSNMDYFLSDNIHSPVTINGYFSEKLIRLPQCYLCYAPPGFAPPVSLPTPAEKEGVITFGCFNNAAKINREVIRLWAKVLHAVPESRLMLKSKALDAVMIREEYYASFKEEGITEERLLLSGWSSHTDTLERYGVIDIALDPFPFSGGLTTCDALWMGVPVITLAGEWMVSRQTATYLTHLGLPQLIAQSPDRYIELARELSASTEKLTLLRSVLRKRMAASPLCKGKEFTVSLETAYSQMWEVYCGLKE